MFLAEGPNAARAAFGSKAQIVDLFVGEEADLSSLEMPPEVVPLRVTNGVLQGLTDTSTPQGIAAIVEIPDTSLAALPPEASFVLVLADVRDPGNAGTLIRSALGAGADAIVFSTGSVDPFGPKTVRASAGALFGLPVLQGSFEDAVTRLKEKSFLIVGTQAGSPPIHSLDLTGPVAFVLGNEAWGLSASMEVLLDEKVGIPMPGPTESLNVAVAGSILLFEAARQRAMSV